MGNDSFHEPDYLNMYTFDCLYAVSNITLRIAQCNLNEYIFQKTCFFTENLARCFVTFERFPNKGKTHYTLHECKNMNHLMQ